MDLYARFDLPPPPPPTIFSQDHTFARARMPNFTSIKEVADFLDHTMLDLASKRSDRFQIFAIVFGSAILTTLSLLVIHKVYYEDWWIFRLVSRGHNSIVLPNVHATWIVFISLYGWIRIGFSIVKHIGHVRHEPVPHKILWTATMWTPACFAAWYQAWAITAARGSSVPPLEEATPGRSKGRSIPAWLINLVYLSLPAVPAFVALVAGVIGNRHYERARKEWFSWHTHHGDAQDLSREVLLDAQDIYHANLRGVFHLSVAMAVWTFTCLIFGSMYCWAAFRLILDLRKHIQEKRTARSTAKTSMGTETLAASTLAKPSPECHASDVETLCEGIQQSVAIGWQVVSGRDSGATINSGDHVRLNGVLGSQTLAEKPMQVRPLSLSDSPITKPSKVALRLETLKAYQVLFTFFIQSSAVTLSCLTFVVLGLLSVIRYYPAAERNEFQTPVAVNHFAAAIASLVAGTASAFAMMNAQFETKFTALLQAWHVDKDTCQDRASNFLEME
ncbi:hypothetical protein CF319_g897 [Tilletia indica]|nr:hypothetical protein CF319_g897 [Tilletia indica]